ncbi:MAG TPA: DMT family transporter [Tepidisphaeraceae bacterium]|jgi:drug/metabolite transporter (DMT)-like permease
MAVASLLLGTVFWGCGFTWAKAAGEAVQAAAGLSRGAPFGPIFLLAWRFLLAATIWFLVFPASRRGWTWRGFGWATLVGVLLGAGLIVQHVGLDRTSEAVSAFLTSLTILFVPLLMMFAFRKPPRPVLWIGVALATLGVWLMTGAQPAGFGLGEILGLACAFLFSLYILAVNAASVHETPWRMVGAQFGITAIICFVSCAFLRGGATNLHPIQMAHILAVRTVCLNLALLTFFTTLVAFGLLTFFQPKIDPTRAALIYLAEPVFATLYAAIAVGHKAGIMTLAGAGLILLANVLVEVLSARGAHEPQEKVVLLD